MLGLAAGSRQSRHSTSAPCAYSPAPRSILCLLSREASLEAVGRHRLPKGNKEDVVKTVSNNSRIFRGMVLACAVLLATSAFAANRGSVQLSQPTQVAGKQLAPGTYSVQWDGSGNDVQLNFMQGKKQVASTTAHIVAMQPAAQADNALINVNSDGSRSLAQIRFRGKTFALDLTGDGSGSGSSGAAR